MKLELLKQIFCPKCWHVPCSCAATPLSLKVTGSQVVLNNGVSIRSSFMYFLDTENNTCVFRSFWATDKTGRHIASFNVFYKQNDKTTTKLAKALEAIKTKIVAYEALEYADKDPVKFVEFIAIRQKELGIKIAA